MVRTSLPLSLLLGALLLSWAGRAEGQFTTPLQLSSSGSGFSDLGIARDVADNIIFVYQDSVDIYYSSTLFGGGLEINVTDNALVNGHARVATGGLGVSHVVYEQEGVQPGNQGMDILLIDNNGGPFTNPVNITFSSIDDRHPEITQLLPSSQNLVVYQQNPAGGPEVYVSINGGSSSLVSPGQEPVVTSTFDDAAHIGYRRDDQLFYRRFVAGALDPEATISDLPGINAALELARDFQNTVHAVFLNAGAIYYSSSDGTGFSAPVMIVAGPVDGSPRLNATGTDHVVVVYEVVGQIFVVEKNAGPFGASVLVTPTATAASGPVVILDSLGHTHVGYEENGLIYYTNNVPPPIADFTADITGGELPLTVSFENLSTGIFDQALWDFGDGETSTLENPTHTYLTPGSKTVSLTVTGPGGSSTETKPGFIDCQAPSNVLRLETISVFAAQQDIRHLVRAEHIVGLQGFQLAVAFDNEVTPVVDVTLEDSATIGEDPEFAFLDIVTDGPDVDYFIMAVILDTAPPFDGRVIDPGMNQVLASLVYSIPIGTPLGTTGFVEFRNGELGNPPLINIFTIEGGLSVLPFLISGTVNVDSPPGVTFRRGDANFTVNIDLVDAIFLLNFLFNSGAEPPCMDAADFSDDGILGLVDAIGLLSFLFASGTPPDYPYPAAGLDPTPDGLDCSP